MAEQREQEIAIMEGGMNAAEDAHFAARPGADTGYNRHIFREGFRRAWDLKAQPTADDQARRDAMPEIESLIPAGWVFSSADFSRKAMCNDPVGSVVLVRDEAGRKWWHSLDDMGRDQEELYASGWGRTFTDAVKAAAERAQAASAAEGH